MPGARTTLLAVLWCTCGATLPPPDDATAFRFTQELACLKQAEGPATPEGRIELCLLGRKGAARAILPAVRVRRANGTVEEVWRDRDRGFHPDSLEVVELDGDAQPEVAIGVFKRTRFDPVPRRRLFVYDFTGHSLHAKWLGSRFALPLLAFTFVRAPGAEVDTLITVESDGRRVVARTHHWNGFGFTSDEVLLETVRSKTAASPSRLLEMARARWAEKWSIACPRRSSRCCSPPRSSSPRPPSPPT